MCAGHVARSDWVCGEQALLVGGHINNESKKKCWEKSFDLGKKLEGDRRQGLCADRELQSQYAKVICWNGMFIRDSEIFVHS
jgi:hypothetical protein